MVGGKTPRLSDFDGDHELKLLEIRSGDEDSIFYAADFEVVKSSNPALRPGTKLGWVTTRGSKFPAYFFSDIKRFLGALRGEDAEEIDEEKMAESEDEKFEGLGCQINALVTRSSRVDKETGKPYGNVVFSTPQG